VNTSLKWFRTNCIKKLPSASIKPLNHSEKSSSLKEFNSLEEYSLLFPVLGELSGLPILLSLKNSLQCKLLTKDLFRGFTIKIIKSTHKEKSEVNINEKTKKKKADAVLECK
jgi:hypothetical protein